MPAAQAAEANIEFNEVLAGFADDYAQIRCPVTHLKASGGNLGASEEEMRATRANLDHMVANYPNVTVFATVPASHTRIVAKHPDTIAAAVDTLAIQAAG